MDIESSMDAVPVILPVALRLFCRLFFLVFSLLFWLSKRDYTPATAHRMVVVWCMTDPCIPAFAGVVVVVVVVVVDAWIGPAVG